ncbi:MAG TPA: double-strand break repair protein AddB [Rhodopila sp.]|nr:double-strand break repair protein AddB [Rhodopila sp.]
MALNLYTVPPHTPFLDAIARGWLARGDDPLTVSRGLILLPTRRSARALADAFLRVREGRPMLLPRITALGALDEAPLTLAGALDLPPAVEPMHRLAALSRLILAMNGHGGAPRTADRAWLLARELASLMDEAERAGIDLAERLPDAADPAFAAHWNETLTFLHIVTNAWPAWLAENGVMNPAARQAALLEAQARAWEDHPPDHPVLIAGTTAGIPAVARLLRVVARLPAGQVVLPHLDLAMDAAAWDALEPSHAQAGLARLLADLGATRGDVQPWPHVTDGLVPDHRFAVLSRAMLPAVALHDWMDRAPVPVDGLSRLTAADQQQEAQAIALVLRDALETPGARGALVTPDRDLAGRVAAALLRFGIIADDSAGEPLGDTPPAVFLRLLVRAVADHLAPVPLLAVLKHPLAAAGLTPMACREAARTLETLCLRGPRPAEGIKGLRKAVAQTGTKTGAKTRAKTGDTRAGDTRLTEFLARLETCLEPALRFETAMAIPPAEALTAVIQAAERLAATPDSDGPARLWAGEEGQALAERLATVRDAVGILPDLQRGTLPGLLDAVLEGAVVRSRRALRGRGGTEHPRIFIWGLLEARLQAADLIVLGGLAETVWPPMAEPGPWLSRPMRAKVGLPAPEEAVGQAAHDFLSACCSAPQVVLSCPVRRDSAPAVPARWLTRLDMFLAGRDGALAEHPAAGWARALDLPSGDPVPVRPPQPRPPLHLRPRRLSVTAIETWLRDPYAIHARHILKLEALAPLDQGTDASDYGSIVHAGLHRFLEANGANWPADAAARLRTDMANALGSAGLRPALVAWWAPRLERIADWIAAVETARRQERPPVRIAAEVAGGIDLVRPGGVFRLHGRADRVEVYEDGTLAILDYKTGRPPTQNEVDAGLAPQLLLEAAIAAEAGFPDLAGTAAQLIYWHLSGGIEPGKAYPLFRDATASIPDAVAQATERLCALIDDFDRPERAYLSRPHPDHGARFSDYEQLARVAEWSSAGGGDA